jgi:hypothetical protein
MFALLIVSSASAQLPIIVQGTVLNPDSSLPALNDIEYTAYILTDTTDKQIDSVSAGGGWAVELLYGFAGGVLPWSPGDTLFVRFKNISQGAFQGAFSYLKYATTNSPLQTADTTSLPVELTEFVLAYLQDAAGHFVRLSWRTISETNNHGFEIQRSQNNIDFESLDFIAGAGTTSAPRTYEYIDKDIQVGSYYYRIKQIDNNGIVQFTDVQHVDVTAPTSYVLKQNFPNPFNPTTNIIYHLKEKGKVKLSVYNILGREIATLVNNVQEAGIHTINFDARAIPSGVYFYRLQANNFDQIRKMAVLK